MNKKTSHPSGFSEEEKAAMRERAEELRAAGKKHKDETEAERAVLTKIAEMDEPDRTMAMKLHELVKRYAPGLVARTWYGMPAYANSDGKVVCHFQSAQKFKTRYSTLGFSDRANLDDGQMWPVAFALKRLTSVEEERIALLLNRALERGQH